MTYRTCETARECLPAWVLLTVVKWNVGNTGQLKPLFASETCTYKGMGNDNIYASNLQRSVSIVGVKIEMKEY